ncbi:MAG: hypothetical protein Q8O53_00640 [Candidatus Moranbacteria bacterium]|nr:hypothetical protein [Candidatus Moranbacteria bacterium]
MEAVANHNLLPKKVLVRDEVLVSELALVAERLGFVLEAVKTLKVVPVIFRDMTQLFGK